MTVTPMQQTISYLLAYTAKAHRSYANDLLCRIGLHVGQEMILLYLWQEDGLTQSQLAGLLEVQLPTVTKMLSRMEKSGLVERRGDAEDSRVSRVYLTERGRDAQESVERVWEKLEVCTTSELTAGEQAVLRRLLTQVHANLTRRV